MSIQYTNRKGETYFLRLKVSEQGRKSYYLSRSRGEQGVEKMPRGIEIYEDPVTGDVVLRKKERCRITDLEKYRLNKFFRSFQPGMHFLVDIQNASIVIFEGSASLAETLGRNGFMKAGPIDPVHLGDSVPVARFRLFHESRRLFQVDRYTHFEGQGVWQEVGNGPCRLEHALNLFSSRFEMALQPSE